MGHTDSMAVGKRPRPWNARDKRGGLLARLHWNHEKRVEGVGLEVPGGTPMQTLGAQSVCHTLLSSFTTSS